MGAASVMSIAAGNAAGSRSRNGHSRATVERLQWVKQKYDTSDKIERAFEKHGTELLRKLNERGILPHASVDKLQISDPLSTEEYVDASEGTHVMGVLQGDKETPTAQIYVRRQTRKYNILLSVKPEADEAYAIYNELGDSEKQIVSDAEDGSFSTQHSGCIEEAVCIITDSWCQEMYVHCCGSTSCHEDDLTGGGCSDDECCWSHCCEACCQCDPGCGSC